MTTFGGLEMGIFGFGKKKIEEEKEVNLSRRKFLGDAGKIAGLAVAAAAGAALGVKPTEAFASNMSGWPTAIVKSDYEVVRFFYDAYLTDRFKGSKDLLQKSLSCRTSWSRQEGVEEAFANDPAMAYVAQLFNKSRNFKGELSFGHDGEKRFGASNQRFQLEKENPAMVQITWTIGNYLSNFMTQTKNNYNSTKKKAYQTLSLVLYDSDKNWESIKNQIENGKPINVDFNKITKKSKKLAALWAAGILTRTHNHLDEKQLGNYTYTYLEKPIEKVVGYGLGKLDF